MPEILTTKEVASYLKLHEITVLKHASKGLIPAIRIGRVWRFDKDIIDEWLQHNYQRMIDIKPDHNSVSIIYKTISRSRQGLSINALKEKTGIERKEIRAVISKLKKHGKIKSSSRGIYVKV